MSIILRYAKIPRKDGSLRNAPLIPIEVKTIFGRNVEVIALLDSGADTTIVPKELAEQLGLKCKEEMDTGGIGGSVKVKKSRFKIKGKNESHFINVPALVLQDYNEDVPLLLGRHGFFEHFHITFKQNKQKIVLKKNPPKRIY